MSLQDDYFDLRSDLNGHQKKQLNRIWKALCEAETDAREAEDCVRLVNSARSLLADKPPIFTDYRRRKARSMKATPTKRA